MTAQQIYYKDWGKGPVVTFSHGWPLNSDAWDGQMLFLAQNGYPRRRARPSRAWPVEPGLLGQRHERLCRRSCGRDRGARSPGRDVGGSLDRRRRSHALHRPSRIAARRQGSPRRCRAADHAQDAGESGGARRWRSSTAARWPHQGPLAVLQGPGDAVLRRQQAGRQGLPGHAGSILALEHAGRSEERLRIASRPSPRPTSPRTSRRSTSRPWSCTAKTTRSFPSRTRRRSRPSSSRAQRKSTIPDAPHGLTATHQDQVNADLLAFLRS